jgi:hypothetical protein
LENTQKQREGFIMKRFLTVFMAAAILAVCGAAFADDSASLSNNKKRTIFGIGFFPGVPNSTNTYNVYGLKLGVPAVGGDQAWVCGQEASILYSSTMFIKGCQATLAGPAIASSMQGLQAATGPAIARNVIGAQASPLTICGGTGYGVQASAVSIANSFYGFQAGAVNIATSNLDGFQFGAVNVVDEEFHGLQAGAVNVMTGRNRGLQLGVVNVATQGGWQLGGICINPKSKLPIMILVNYAESDYVPLAERKSGEK